MSGSGATGLLSVRRGFLGRVTGATKHKPRPAAVLMYWPPRFVHPTICAAPRVHSQILLLQVKGVGPNPLRQILFADEVFSAADQSDQKIQRRVPSRNCFPSRSNSPRVGSNRNGQKTAKSWQDDGLMGWIVREVRRQKRYQIAGLMSTPSAAH